MESHLLDSTLLFAKPLFLVLNCCMLVAAFLQLLMPYTMMWQALKDLPRENVQLATKFGNLRVDGKYQIRGDAAYVRKACEDSLERLGLDYIDLFYQHRVDTTVPIEITVSSASPSRALHLCLLASFLCRELSAER